MKGDRGVVLLNALVLVVALAGVAAFLLVRAETARLRQSAGQDAAQLRLALDAYEALAVQLLSTDRSPGMDHAGEAWAQATRAVPLDRAEVAGQIQDQQGLFNVNWLANTSELWALQGFAQLATDLGLSAPQFQAVLKAFQTQDRQSGSGGAVAMVSQLERIQGLPEASLDQLRPFITALPGGSTLNLNTASPQVIAAMLPGVSAAQARLFAQSRLGQPFGSVEAAVERLRELAGVDAVPEELETRLSVRSDWFAIRATAKLGEQQRHRFALIERAPLPQPVLVAYRLDRMENGEGSN